MGFLTSLFHTPLGFALDISDSALHLLEVRGTGAKDVTSSVHVDIPAGLIEDGRILDQAKLAEVIQRAYEKARPRMPRTKHVVSELPESQTFVTHFAIEKSVSEEELKDAVMMRGEESLPINLEEYAWDYQILARTEQSYEILFAAAPGELVESYEHTFALAGLKLDVLELESLALTRALTDYSKLAPEAAQIVLDMGGRSSTIAFVDQLGLQLSVTLPIAGDALTAAVAEKFGLSPEEAEKRKQKKGLADKEGGEVLHRTLHPLVQEIQQAAAFYEAKTGRKVQRVILAGGTSALLGLPEELQKTLNLPVEQGVPPFSAPALLPQHLAVVSGLALRATSLAKGINFIRDE